jgi:hypothetical protein
MAKYRKTSRTNYFTQTEYTYQTSEVVSMFKAHVFIPVVVHDRLLLLLLVNIVFLITKQLSQDETL